MSIQKAYLENLDRRNGLSGWYHFLLFYKIITKILEIEALKRLKLTLRYDMIVIQSMLSVEIFMCFGKKLLEIKRKGATLPLPSLCLRH